MVTEAVVLAVGGAFLSSTLNVLFDRLATVQALKPMISLFRGTKLRDDLLQKMEILLLTVEKVFGDAEEKQILNPSVKKWVDKLKDAAYDAEDLLDAMAIEDQVQEEQVKDFNTRLDKIVLKLQLIAEEKDILNLKEDQGGKSIPRLPTTSLVDESEVCLRNNDKKHILDILLSDGLNGQKIPVITIVGMGGIGKTTLAQFLYNDDRVKNYFNLRAWVKFLLVLDNVWNESYRTWDLLLRPLQVGVPGSKIIVTTRSQTVSSTMRNALVHDLKRLSKGDCWALFSKHAFGNKNPNEDSTLKGIGEKIVEKCRGLPLAIKTLGSLLHSQVEAQEWDNVLNSRIWDLPAHKSDILPALRLSYHYLPSHLKRCFAYCSLFPKGHKFERRDLDRMWIAEGLVQQPNSRRRTEEVGEQYFHELLSRSIFQQSHDESRFIMHDLVNDLAQYTAGEFCFRFENGSPPQNPARVRHLSCILKPSDKPYKFEAFYGKNKFLRTFLPLRSPGDGKTPFDSGVFNKLFPAPSCLRVLSLSSYNITKFPDSVCNVKQLRYLDLSGAALRCLPERVGCLHNLETLKLSGCHRLTLLPANLWNLTKLEHLDISGTPILELLDSIGNLKELGYLDLSGTKIQFLPEGVCSLYNLQTLNLSRCPHLTCLPTYMENLTKLKHLDIKGTPILQMPPKLGNLKRLLLLTNFVVGDNSGSTVSALKDLRLHGTLSILQLQNVSQTADAEKANLKDKKYLRELILEWDGDPRDGNAQIAAYNPHNGSIENVAKDPHDNDNAQNAVDDPPNGNAQSAADDPHCRDAEIAALSPHNGTTQNPMDNPQNRNGQSGGDDPQNRSAKHVANVLDKLMPGENLERLEIRNYFGMSLPKWLGNASFSKMKSLTLDNCQKCNSLPPLGQLPSLKELTIHHLAGVKIVGFEFYGSGVVAFISLEILLFERMENWEQWLPFTNERGFPSLRKLLMIGCRKLTGNLPVQLPTSAMQIDDCDRLNVCQGATKQ
ncbi:NB-ARC domain-containing disease resistance protein, putative [Theobroma cacao]|uniref:NB-ARC domain-containing disease resistance protein, putative n=1 Tax=Theobroma cacao TaxID=3641 RepID=A0A061FSE2_THECC|nr:NB-ARC domain-containing disease resistance protein, putative [Theobroma cacao]